MNLVNYASAAHIPALRALWQTVFEDDDAFLDLFFTTAFAPERCRFIEEEGSIVAALYWFDTFCEGKKLAYLYAVATAPRHRNRGLCRSLIENTRAALTARGYDGLVLVPQEEELVQMYRRMGFEPCTTVAEFWCGPQIPVAEIHKTDRASYARSRQALLPRGSVIQEEENLAFLEGLADLYTGPGFAAAVHIENNQLRCLELVGDRDMAPRILSALGCSRGFFRCPGEGKPFAMLQPLTADCPKPTYFGFAFD